jgi:hypothetical protein
MTAVIAIAGILVLIGAWLRPEPRRLPEPCPCKHLPYETLVDDLERCHEERLRVLAENERLAAVKNDMYGHPIWLLGDTGYGVSVSVYTQGDGPPTPDFTLFHHSDGFRQALFSVTARGMFSERRGPEVHNVFEHRVAGVLAVAEECSAEAAEEDR